MYKKDKEQLFYCSITVNLWALKLTLKLPFPPLFLSSLSSFRKEMNQLTRMRVE